jgi:hypothetical protein
MGNVNTAEPAVQRMCKYDYEIRLIHSPPRVGPPQHISKTKSQPLAGQPKDYDFQAKL